MHYGTPASLEEVLPYYTHIRRGRPPTPELLDDLVSRYRAIGGPSPLAKISQDQADLILEGLKRRGIEAKLYIGAKHAHPFVAEAVEEMANDGIDRAVGIVLAPHYSSYSVAAYSQYAFEARDNFRPTMDLKLVQRWGNLPAYIHALSRRLKTQIEGLDLSKTLVLFSAHSLPVRIMAEGDPYVAELHETSQLVAEELKIPNWKFAFQSASQTGEPWLGPDILEVIEENKNQYTTMVSCTVGFVSDHLEVLYDLGIETKDKCKELGLDFRLASVINADPSVMDGLADLCASELLATQTLS